MLARKGFVLTAAQAQRVQSCTSLDQLDAWLDRVLDAKCIEDVLG